jgi:hypothetical protein
MSRRNALYIVVIAALLFLVVRKYVSGSDDGTPVAAAQESQQAAENRLYRLRRIAAGIAGKEQIHKQAQAELAEREKGLMKAENKQQAQVSLIELVQNTARANQIEIRGSQESREKVLNDDYGEVSVAVVFTCGMEQLVNFLAALGNQPEIVATDEIHISGGSDKMKNVQVRLVVSTPVPRKLLPEKKGAASL